MDSNSYSEQQKELLLNTRYEIPVFIEYDEESRNYSATDCTIIDRITYTSNKKLDKVIEHMEKTITKKIISQIKHGVLALDIDSEEAEKYVIREMLYITPNEKKNDKKQGRSL